MSAVELPLGSGSVTIPLEEGVVVVEVVDATVVVETTGPPGPPGSGGGGGGGVPAGGTIGQVLGKASATDFDTAWVDQTGGTEGPAGPEGPPGPTAVSSAPNNAAELHESDGLIYVPESGATIYDVIPTDPSVYDVSDLQIHVAVDGAVTPKGSVTVLQEQVIPPDTTVIIGRFVQEAAPQTDLTFPIVGVLPPLRGWITVAGDFQFSTARDLPGGGSGEVVLPAGQVLLVASNGAPAPPPYMLLDDLVDVDLWDTEPFPVEGDALVFTGGIWRPRATANEVDWANVPAAVTVKNSGTGIPFLSHHPNQEPYPQLEVVDKSGLGDYTINAGTGSIPPSPAFTFGIGGTVVESGSLIIRGNTNGLYFQGTSFADTWLHPRATNELLIGTKRVLTEDDLVPLLARLEAAEAEVRELRARVEGA